MFHIYILEISMLMKWRIPYYKYSVFGEAGLSKLSVCTNKRLSD